jgi:hypothetical protein
MTDIDRRGFLTTLGATGTSVALAGCGSLTGNDDGDGMDESSDDMGDSSDDMGDSGTDMDGSDDDMEGESTEGGGMDDGMSDDGTNDDGMSENGTAAGASTGTDEMEDDEMSMGTSDSSLSLLNARGDSGGSESDDGPVCPLTGH